jgi:two-component system LytT family response regulator
LEALRQVILRHSSKLDFADGFEALDDATPSTRPVTEGCRQITSKIEKDPRNSVLKLSTLSMPEDLNETRRRAQGDQLVRLRELLQLERFSRKPSRIAIKTKGKILFIDPAEVSAVEAQGNYVILRRGPDSYVLRGSISELAEKLEPCGFIRIHRSVLVNTSFVQELQPWATGEYILRMRGGKEYTVSRSYKGNLRSIAQFWVGSEVPAEE